MKRIAFLLCLAFAAPAFAQALPAKDAAERTGPPPEFTSNATKPLLDENDHPIPDTQANLDGTVCWVMVTQPSPTGPMQTADYTHCPTMTVGRFLARTLGTRTEDDKNMTLDEGWSRGALANRLRAPNATAIALTDEERVLIKRMIARWSPALIPQAMQTFWPGQAPPPVK